jgi:hypothetical protein
MFGDEWKWWRLDTSFVKIFFSALIRENILQINDYGHFRFKQQSPKYTHVQIRFVSVHRYNTADNPSYIHITI